MCKSSYKVATVLHMVVFMVLAGIAGVASKKLCFSLLVVGLHDSEPPRKEAGEQSIYWMCGVIQDDSGPLEETARVDFNWAWEWGDNGPLSRLDDPLQLFSLFSSAVRVPHPASIGQGSLYCASIEVPQQR